MSGDGNLDAGVKLVQEYERSGWGSAPQWHVEENLKYAVSAEPDAGGLLGAKAARRCANHVCPRLHTVTSEAPAMSNPASTSGADSKPTPSGNADANAAPKQMRCGRCSTHYCSRECQVQSWKVSHKRECEVISAANKGTLSTEQTHVIVEDMLRRIRMYMCPYAAGFSLLHGKGFVMIRSNSTLRQWVHEFPKDCEGNILRRSVQLQYLTLGEFDGLAFEDDFELAVVRPKLEEALEAYDMQKQVVVVVLLRCGFLACITIPMVPDYSISKQLAAMYQYVEMEGPLQLNVDDS
mmetsp:Transcript_16699/g.32431  ORF Transcript_16699/g.32431 Transcript_16699/m.32431 type:complete len:294 (-) Transcript_16699:119-1000(-)|eukprot:CAMPEP_0171490750 /NCGR_PEP_ID=MMETSP0958-20121227/3479_1 /TAXON_ID=87120 /ORGANISM="Aurantiochytrium limacinum, Strain ATCCMYA-1381" /LENGTH=293 /DNA_ID=CAMNT_0012024095 /DNA_START=15 /DNA_END=896 /DNA_ORIENTATION=+